MRTTKSLNLKVMHAPRCKPRSPVPTRARPILEHHRKIAIINRGAQLLALGLPPAHTPREYARAAGGRIYGCFGGNGCSGGACIGQGECMRVCRTGTAGTRGYDVYCMCEAETGSLFHLVLKTGRFALGSERSPAMAPGHLFVFFAAFCNTCEWTTKHRALQAPTTAWQLQRRPRPLFRRQNGTVKTSRQPLTHLAFRSLRMPCSSLS